MNIITEGKAGRRLGREKRKFLNTTKDFTPGKYECCKCGSFIELTEEDIVKKAPGNLYSYIDCPTADCVNKLGQQT